MLHAQMRPEMPGNAFHGGGDYDIVTAHHEINGAPAVDHQQHLHMWIVTGPAGCGKSSVAQYISQELAIPFIEGDDLHTPENRQRMRDQIPLTDNERWPWLERVRDTAIDKLGNAADPTHSGVVVTCSALRQRYRDVIRIAAYKDPTAHIQVHFLYLKSTEQVIRQRVAARKGHYMKDTMVKSQFETLEEPNEKELAQDCIEVDCTPALIEVERSALAKIMEKLSGDVT